MWQFWIDRGGTFTDIVAKQPDGSLCTHKLLSENPECYADASVQGMRELMGVGTDEPFPLEQIAAVKMGTTVATNALLERKGDATLLLITAGFGDLLRIGYQNRPQLFDLNIKLPKLLYQEVIEVPERLDADGQVLQAFTAESITPALTAAYHKGYRSVAIAFLHAYCNPSHELKAAALARSLGFTQVSVGHEVSSLIKLVGRGDTTVADAYLSPILDRYIKHISSALSGGKQTSKHLYFMQSSGGLSAAGSFRGKDAILSGPAGGVVGMARVGEQSGYHQLIGFDMGGTSTDVCHYSGEYERAFETEVAGVRMRTPMLSIHTVAAGGGSVLAFRDGRCQVGPESAKSNPGPACYRRGGPLTVTDANLLLGRVQADHFPAVFGPKGDQKLDLQIVEHKFMALAQEIAQATQNTPQSAEETALGFLEIAIDNMARAIKKVSTEKGYDVQNYTLVCFGGAGGQHACAIADALGMRRILIHPFAGVLSAYGIGLADIRTLHQRQFEQELNTKSLLQAEFVLDQLEKSAQKALAAQGAKPESMAFLRRAHLRYADSHSTLEVSIGNQEDMRVAFEQKHKERFGFVFSGRRIVIEMLDLEGISASEERPVAPAQSRTADLKPPEYVDYANYEGRSRIPLYQREQLGTATQIAGPALVVDPLSTTVIDPGWCCSLEATGNILLERAEAQKALQTQGSVELQANPVKLEIFNNLFGSIAEQMGTTLENTAYSVNIKERLDFSCALFDAQGNLVANAPHVPVHLGSMSDSVRSVLRLNADTMRDGDSYMLNSPFQGGTHLPDVTVVTPVFSEDSKTLLFFVASRGHHADIGGKTPGSSPPDSRHIQEEGVLIENFLLTRDGQLRGAAVRTLLASGDYPCRNIDQNMADIEAQIAANATGIAEIRRMINTFGLEVVQAYMRYARENAEAITRQAISQLKDGEFEYMLDSGQRIKVAIRIDRQRKEAVIDFSGTSPQSAGNYNAPLAVCRAVVLYVFRTLIGKDIPMNEGCLKPLKIITPVGSMLDITYPAAVIAGNTEVSQAIAECLYGALGVLAGSQGTMNNCIWGTDSFQNYETIGGGTGAGIGGAGVRSEGTAPDGGGFAGADAVHSHMTNTRMTDPEVLEKRFPVRVEQQGIRRNSGGQGLYKGGCGMIRRLRFLSETQLTLLTSNRIQRPFGVQGGEPGKAGVNRVLRRDGSQEELQGNDSRLMQPGDCFEMLTPGGGGWGAKHWRSDEG